MGKPAEKNDLMVSDSDLLEAGVDTLPAVLDENKEGINFESAIDRSDFGDSGTLRGVVLNWVADQRYDEAIRELNKHLKEKSEYPEYHERVERFVKHGVDLIYAIKAKRSFPGIHALTRAKQQELRDKFKEHFEELIYSLKKIEKIKTDLRIQDARSTIYVIKTLWYSILAIVVLMFIIDINDGLAKSAVVVFFDMTRVIADLFLGLFGL